MIPILFGLFLLIGGIGMTVDTKRSRPVLGVVCALAGFWVLVAGVMVG